MRYLCVGEGTVNRICCVMGVKNLRVCADYSMCRRSIPVYLIGPYGSSVLVRPVGGIPSMTRGVAKLGRQQ